MLYPSVKNTLNGFKHTLNPLLQGLVECRLTVCNFTRYLCIILATKEIASVYESIKAIRKKKSKISGFK